MKLAAAERIYWGFAFLPGRNPSEWCVESVFIGVCGHRRKDPDARNRGSDALLRAPSRWLGHQSRQTQQVVRGAAEDEQPVYLFQSAQLHLTQRSGLLQPSGRNNNIVLHLAIDSNPVRAHLRNANARLLRQQRSVADRWVDTRGGFHGLSQQDLRYAATYSRRSLPPATVWAASSAPVKVLDRHLRIVYAFNEYMRRDYA